MTHSIDNGAKIPDYAQSFKLNSESSWGRDGVRSVKHYDMRISVPNLSTAKLH